ncbi:Quino amine beta chain-like RIC1-like guanyl-nucleotide exchange factor [Micractinium conductrix]|uniref:Quino amine beta chain-like RIC1-like guanyl-nucleotide exchange factor n=1 Tax=Micractinium conductrix TaxID=554055 RepID=A0A2P6UZY5_9CHLO|nr:Quino amine beta chain-like RIC1-like guanyl-nucleotide exchange factor [Micractinium conductrix]|eukprot:PSC67405.1 Quino amine beta chain-like RIC1-like guanyl-nucleotide exchange factor [Micractinium conductrix]
MYFCYGWPKALATGAGPADGEAIALWAGGEFIVAVYAGSIQVWSGGQHRLKRGELHRTPEAVEEEGPNLRAHWCPQKRVLAVATARNHLQLYALNQSSEALWRLPSGGEVRRINLYLSHSLHLDYGTVRIADLGGDAKSLLVALSNGTMQVFSWQGKLRGQANPFIAAYEGSRSRLQRGLPRLSSTGVPSRPSLAGASDELAGSSNGLAGLSLSGGPRGQGASASAPVSRAPTGGSTDAGEPPSALLAAFAAMDLPQPTPVQPAEVTVACIHYAPAARMLAVVLADGRCALCRTADSGIQPVEQLTLFRWVYKPAAAAGGGGGPAAVAVALNPAAQLLALGLSHGRVAIYTLQSLLSTRHHQQHPRSTSSSGTLRPGDSLPTPGGGSASSGGPGQPDPSRVLSLSDWGYSSAVVGAASVLQWSPDGRVLAVGYAQRGMAVWTPSGCRLMCSLRHAVATSAPGTTSVTELAGTPGRPAPAVPRSPQQQQQQAAGGGVHHASTDGGSAHGPGSPKRAAVAGGLWSQRSDLNPGGAPEAGILEAGISALAWSAHGYQLLVAEQGQAARLHQLEFARQMVGSHRVVQPAAAPGGAAAPGQEELQALQAADRLLLVTEARQAVNPELRLPATPGSEASEAEAAGVRPDLVLQHVKLPQQYVDTAYPLLHAAISQDRADVAVAGTQGLAVYSRRARRWRLFGDATQERSLTVQSLAWLPAGVIAAVAHVEGKEGGGTPQLLLYPQYHLDNASLLARLPLKQVPVAMDAAGWHLALAFQPLEIKLFRVTVEGPLGTSGRPIARLAVVRELSIMGLGNPLQELALVDPATLAPPEASRSMPASSQSSQQQLEQQGATAQQQQQAAAAGRPPTPGGSGGSWPQLTVATKALPAAPAAGGNAPLQCVLLRAGGIMSKLDLQEGSEVLLSDSIERFWLPLSSASATAGASGLVSRTNSFTAAGGVPDGAPSLSASSSAAALGRQSSEVELPAAGASAGMAAAAAARMAQRQRATDADEAVPGQPPQVEMPWWTYGARGMQLWFPSSLSEPLTPMRSLTSPTATGLAAAAAAGSTNSTDPELEFDREVYPTGISLAEVSIIGVMQRTVRSQSFPPGAPQSLCYHPVPESQPVLPCLLRRLLQKGRQEDAYELARWHSQGPHFNRSLEWLLFTSVELDAEEPTSTPAGQRPATPGGQQHRFNSSYAVTLSSMQGDAQQGQQQGGALGADALARQQAAPLLVAAARLISQFPQFPEIVVSVARKTDAALWPALFAAVGSPGRLCQGLMQADKLQSAACCLVIVERIEGSAPAQAATLQLMQAALTSGQYGLAADLLRFLVPPGEADMLLDSPGVSKAAAAAAASAHPASPLAAARQPFEQQQATQQVAQQQQQEQGAAAAPQQQSGGGAAQHTAQPPAQQQQQAEQAGEDTAAASEAWRMTAQHAWKMLDAGALREAAQLARSLAGMHGGLPALLAATAGEAPSAATHLVPGAAAIASALFVAANEFASPDAAAEATLLADAELLLQVCQDAGCLNLAAALALLLGDQDSLERFAVQHAVEWQTLYNLISNDVHLCGYAPVLSPAPSPAVGGGRSVGGLLAA